MTTQRTSNSVQFSSVIRLAASIATLFLLIAGCAAFRGSVPETETVDQCMESRAEALRNCFNITAEIVEAEGLERPTVDQQARVDEVYADYKSCVDDVPECESESLTPSE